MKANVHQPGLLVFMTMLFLLLSEPAFAAKKVLLATAERAPYIGKNLLNQGYLHELITEAFKRVGYETEIIFYPQARANYLAERGSVDGLLPSYFEPGLEKNYLFSAPFPGDNIGLLKRKSLAASYPLDPRNNLQGALLDLLPYKFGVVRGTSISPAFDQATLLKKQFVAKDLQNIDKLAVERIDFAVIDKYTASDLMVNRRPHLIGELEFMRPPLLSNSFYVAFSKKSPGYQQRQKDFNLGLQALIADGTLQEILFRHGLFPAKTQQQGKVQLTIGTVNNADMIAMRGLSKQFEQSHPNIELQWRVLSENILRQRLLSDLAISDGQFDIMTIGAYETPIWAKRGWLTALENLPDGYQLQDIFDSVREALSYQKKLYALPFYAESSMTFYRQDLFAKAGLKMSERPTFADIKSYAAAIHNPEEKIYGICLRGKAGWGENMALLSTMVNTFGGQWFDLNWQPKLNSREWKNALLTYQDLLSNYGPPNPTLNGFNENRSLFANGHCAIWIDATVAAGMLFNAKQSKVHAQVGFAPAPVAVTEKGSKWLWTWALAIPDSSKHKQEALQFITWATSKAYIERVGEKLGWVSVPPGTRKSTYQNKSYLAAAPFAGFVLQAIQQADPLNSTLQAKLYTGIQFVGIPEFPALGGQVGLNIADVIAGKLSVDQALQDSQKLVEEQMRKSGYY